MLDRVYRVILRDPKGDYLRFGVAYADEDLAHEFILNYFPENLGYDVYDNYGLYVVSYNGKKMYEAFIEPVEIVYGI